MNVARLLQIRELRVRVLFRAWPPQKAIRLAGPLLSLPIRIPDSTIVSCGQKPYTFRRAMSTLADSDDESHRDPAKLRKRYAVNANLKMRLRLFRQGSLMYRLSSH
jgi:hypothetical protein